MATPFTSGALPSETGASGTLVSEVLDDEAELLVTVTLEEIEAEEVRDATPVGAPDVILWLA
jgi:hypothetical protein